MRRLFSAAESGLSEGALRWGERTGRWRRIERSVYGEGPEAPSRLDRALAVVLATGGVASGEVAGVLLGLDTVHVRGVDVTLPAGRRRARSGVRRRDLPDQRIVCVHGFRCTDGLQTMIDLAAQLEDLRWEQALESALRLKLVSVADLEQALPHLGRSRTPGTARIRRVLVLRPERALPTESLLETLMVQLVRRVPNLADPVRQFRVENHRVDLAWPELGLFVELDGQHHRDQPVYDARRETAIVAATGWLCGRFTWDEVVRIPTTTARRLGALADQAISRTGRPGRTG